MKKKTIDIRIYLVKIIETDSRWDFPIYDFTSFMLRFISILFNEFIIVSFWLEMENKWKLNVLLESSVDWTSQLISFIFYVAQSLALAIPISL